MIQRIHRTFITLIIMLSVVACSDEPAGPGNPTCSDPRDGGIGGLRVASFAYMVVDMADDKSCLLVREKYSSQLVVVGVQSNERLYALDVSDLLPNDGSRWTLVGCGFLGRSSDSVFVSCVAQRNRDATASRNYVVNIRTGSISEIRPSRCLENGWDPVLKRWFYVNHVERLPDRTLLVGNYSFLYDYAGDVFLEGEMPDPQDGSLIYYRRTCQSGYLVGIRAKVYAYDQRSIKLVVDGKTFDFSSFVFDADVESSIRGTDLVILQVIPKRYSSSSGKGWLSEMWVVDVGRLMREGSVSNAIVVKRNLHEAYCSLATLGINAYAYDLDHIYITMHHDGEFVQTPFRISLNSPTDRSPVTYQ